MGTVKEMSETASVPEHDHSDKHPTHREVDARIDSISVRFGDLAKQMTAGFNGGSRKFEALFKKLDEMQKNNAATTEKLAERVTTIEKECARRGGKSNGYAKAALSSEVVSTRIDKRLLATIGAMQGLTVFLMWLVDKLG